MENINMEPKRCWHIACTSTPQSTQGISPYSWHILFLNWDDLFPKSYNQSLPFSTLRFVNIESEWRTLYFFYKILKIKVGFVLC